MKKEETDENHEYLLFLGKLMKRIVNIEKYE